MPKPRTVLMIAFQFPPFAGSSAVQRTLRFSRYLPQHGWKPVVLTANPMAYEVCRATEGNEIPDGLEVHRAWSLDAARHLSLFGKYPRTLAVPDRWATWKFFAMRAAKKVIRNERVDAIWSTFPIATAHHVGKEISQWAKIPWVAEFRDPMWQGDYPPDPKVNESWRLLETEIFSKASHVVTTTPGARVIYEERFPGLAKGRISVISNGFDEDVFQRAEGTIGPASANMSRPYILLHSGVVYSSERDPTQLFGAIAALKQAGDISASKLQVVLRASGNEAEIREALRVRNIEDIVRLEPSIDYLAALNEMLTADALLVLQASNCNAQIPAKLYEYMRSGRPILALTDPVGDTAAALREAGLGLTVPLDSQELIAAALLKMVSLGRLPTQRPNVDIRRYSRESLTGQLADVLESVTSDLQT